MRTQLGFETITVQGAPRNLESGELYKHGQKVGVIECDYQQGDPFVLTILGEFLVAAEKSSNFTPGNTVYAKDESGKIVASATKTDTILGTYTGETTTTGVDFVKVNINSVYIGS